jgi:ribonuclease Z
MQIKLTILGNNSAVPAHGRHPTAQVVEIREQLFLIDCGEGTQIQMQRFDIKRRRINYIFISHLHGDHYFGLIGLINSLGLMGRTAPLHLFGPPALKDIIDLQLTVANTILPYEIVFTALLPESSTILVDTPHYSVKSFPVEHRIPCHGFVITSKSSGRKIIPEQCKAYEVPAAYFPHLKNGADYERKDGFLVKNEWVTDNGPLQKSYAYAADTRYTQSFIEHIQDADALYHESTYLADDTERATERFHSTAAQAAMIAKTAQVRQLFLGHYSSKYKTLEGFTEEACAIFPSTIVTEEGMTYVL